MPEYDTNNTALNRNLERHHNFDKFQEEYAKKLDASRNFLEDTYGPVKITWGTPLWNFAGGEKVDRLDTYEWIMGLENNPNKEEIELSDIAKDHITNTLKNFPKFEIVNWSFNISRKGDYQKPYPHTDCDLVSIWNITSPLGTFHLQADHSYIKLRKPLAEKMNMPLSHTPNIRVGDLLVFPSDVLYWTRPWEYDDDDGEIIPRVSISFDLKFV